MSAFSASRAAALVRQERSSLLVNRAVRAALSISRLPLNPPPISLARPPLPRCSGSVSRSDRPSGGIQVTDSTPTLRGGVWQMASEGAALELPGSPRTYAEAVKEDAPVEVVASRDVGVKGGSDAQADVAEPPVELDALPEANGWQKGAAAVHEVSSGEDGALPHAIGDNGREKAALVEASGGDQGFLQSEPQVEELQSEPQAHDGEQTANGESKEKNSERGFNAPGANGGEQAEVVKDENLELGFARKEMYAKPLVGSVQLYERHVFLCYKDPESWPSRLEASEDRLPRSLASALKARREDMPLKTRMTVCEARTDSSNGDVLIFPEMTAYKALSHADVDTFVDQVLVHGRAWKETPSEQLSASFVFVCSHGSKDRRCGFCGPVLIDRFEQEIEKAGLVGQVVVRACSHIGGHKYAGNVIIFRPSEGEGKQAQGHWFGYVTPDDVPVLLEEHIGKGEITERLWRGQMGVGEAEQKESQSRRMGAAEAERECACAKAVENGVTGDFCCKTVVVPVVEPIHTSPEVIKHAESVLTSRAPRWFKLSSWVETWERGDTLAALAVVGAASAAVAAYYVVRATRD